MLQHISELYFFSLLNKIPLFGYSTFCLSIHPLVDAWVASTFWLLRIMLLGTLMYKFLCRHMFSFTLGGYQRVGLLGKIVKVCLTL